jgi:hypothetical protein
MTTQRHGPYAILTDGSGEATVDTDDLSGLIDTIELVVPGSGGIAAARLIFTLATTGVEVLVLASVSASGIWRPEGPTHDEADGSELLHAAAVASGDRVCSPIPVAGEPVRCAVSGAGVGETASFYIDVIGGS